MQATFGEYIKSLRVENGLTLTKLAATLDIDQSTLSKVENRKRCLPIEALPKLAKTFALDLNELKKEYYSEKIAEIIYSQNGTSELLELAEKKVKYLRIIETKQRKIDFEL